MPKLLIGIITDTQVKLVQSGIIIKLPTKAEIRGEVHKVQESSPTGENAFDLR